tara:strand:+ start:110 stop:736 length:627 start_codon:yes stop_codon:yes gene_type:complete
MSDSFSQFKQDLHVLESYNYKKNGYFIEIGASDGIRLSNTYLLETKYNWNGICVEPVPEVFDKLCKNRPNSICINNPIYCISDQNIHFAISNHKKNQSGIDKHIDRHKKKIGNNKTIVNLKTLSFNDLLKKCQSPNFIDYLSLDTEGSEYEILKTFDFDKYTIGIIHVEHNRIEPRRTQIRNLLLSNGYIFIKKKRVDDFYRHKSLKL